MQGGGESRKTPGVGQGCSVAPGWGEEEGRPVEHQRGHVGPSGLSGGLPSWLSRCGRAAAQADVQQRGWPRWVTVLRWESWEVHARARAAATQCAVRGGARKQRVALCRETFSEGNGAAPKVADVYTETLAV